MPEYCLAVHGGAGTLVGRDPAMLGAMREALCGALSAGGNVLECGGSSLSAVVAAASVLEDAECFNAGRGAVLRSDGGVHLDASVMCGAGAKAGAVALVRTAKNPIQLALKVLERGHQVLLVGQRADEFVQDCGLPTARPDYFLTPHRERQWQSLRDTGGVSLDHDGQTVGAVALDSAGSLAGATSTGGMTNADPGRVGDSPIVGAGTWALNGFCAVSGTGTGEAYIRTAFAHNVHARLRWGNQSLNDAALGALEDVALLGGEGGCVAIDARGTIVTPFITGAMPRAYLDRQGDRYVAVFKDDWVKL